MRVAIILFLKWGLEQVRDANVHGNIINNSQKGEKS